MTMTRLAIVSVTLLVLAACTGRSAPPNAYAAYADFNFASAEDEAYVTAAGDLSQAANRQLTALPGARGYGPRDVMALTAGGFVLIAVEPGDGGEQLVLSLGADSGATVWTHGIGLAAGTAVGAVKLATIQGVAQPVLDISLSNAGGVDRVLLALTAQAPVVLRAESGGALSNAALLAAHPLAPVLRGSLAGPGRFEQLAATVALSAADLAAERQSPAVQGHLKTLAAGNDTWLAQAAADLLTR